jgi:hypothetical protein
MGDVADSIACVVPFPISGLVGAVLCHWLSIAFRWFVMSWTTKSFSSLFCGRDLGDPEGAVTVNEVMAFGVRVRIVPMLMSKKDIEIDHLRSSPINE